jgi:hypothetical protein
LQALDAGQTPESGRVAELRTRLRSALDATDLEVERWFGSAALDA